MSNKLKDFHNIINLLKENFKDRIYFEIQRHNEHLEKNFENFILNNSKIQNSFNCNSRSFLSP